MASQGNEVLAQEHAINDILFSDQILDAQPKFYILFISHKSLHQVGGVNGENFMKSHTKNIYNIPQTRIRVQKKLLLQLRSVGQGERRQRRRRRRS